MANVGKTCILRLDLCAVIIVLIHADYSRCSPELKVRQHINKTVSVGETVTLHCNKTKVDDDFGWKMNGSVIFRLVSNMNVTRTNFSSNRIHIDPRSPGELIIHQIQESDAGNYTCFPAAMRWTLTVTDTTGLETLKQMSLHIFIITISCCGVIMVGLIITISIYIQRSCKNKKQSHRETGRDFPQPPARGRIRTQNSQYFERYNSVYGQL
ncbi:uncharacterized protein LOC122332310 isoform X2 [Puntigrus tetrazona]|uniref:uncharacterized protein LOC122332310 isoform X2 n=1 Tax=Puntigrus tetrazona TaxID=1606681 RepID=UPI001C8AE960|nr:uncharacterized protein LOC122332310 isoform X2 [Puntigrus tetrazona]